MDLSIIIVNWNGGSYLLDCLESLYACGPTRETEVLVVDNGSKDGSLDLIRSSFPYLTLIEVGTNLGFARAANLGWRCTRGKYVLFLIGLTHR